MFTKETVRKEIKSILEGPVTSGSVRDLAGLLYIKRHCPELSGEEPMDAERICEWVSHMENADGTTGPHWTASEALAIQRQFHIACNPEEFYAALNMMYSDYCEAAAAAGASTVELYARMAKAFLDDKDAQPDKLARYYTYIARHG